MEKYKLLADVVNAENAENALELLKKCEIYRNDDTFNSLYLAVSTYVAEWRIRTKKWGK